MTMVNNPVIRFEKFGGIIAKTNPPLLAFVDKNFIRKRYKKTSPLWNSADDRVLSAPVEAHYSVTNFCPSECPGCYMASGRVGQTGGEENDAYQQALHIADSLIDMQIFHVALGGGESFSAPWFIDLASYFRSNGIVPNVTTSGYYLSESLVKKCRVFGQVNVSIDSIGDRGNPLRPQGHFEMADAAVRLLKENGIRTGINCIISRHNYEHLEEIIRYAKKNQLTDIEFLRFKPAGRGKEIYHDMKLTGAQGRALFPTLRKLARRYRIALKLDCSFTPFVCYHKPSKKVLNYFSILGCDAGNWLIGVGPQGNVSPCSFIEDADIDFRVLKQQWGREETFSVFRKWDQKPVGKCAECRYVSICKGGCHAVSRYLSGTYSAPDPECPFIVDGA